MSALEISKPLQGWVKHSYLREIYFGRLFAWKPRNTYDYQGFSALINRTGVEVSKILISWGTNDPSYFGDMELWMQWKLSEDSICDMQRRLCATDNW